GFWLLVGVGVRRRCSRGGDVRREDDQRKNGKKGDSKTHSSFLLRPDQLHAACHRRARSERSRAGDRSDRYFVWRARMIWKYRRAMPEASAARATLPPCFARTRST